jgi:hypothetical protein
MLISPGVRDSKPAMVSLWSGSAEPAIASGALTESVARALFGAAKACAGTYSTAQERMGKIWSAAEEAARCHGWETSKKDRTL